MNKSKKLTLSDLANLAGVSSSTASRALKNNPVIKQQTRDKIFKLAKEHNFSVNAAASRLRTQKTNVVAVILNITDHTEQRVSDPFLLKIVGDLNQALNQAGYELLLSNSLMATSDWANYFITSQRADGIIVVGQGKDDKNLTALVDSGLPFVLWGDPHFTPQIPTIGSDNHWGGHLATSHLIAGGAKRILFLGDPEHAEMSERHKGYCSALEAHKLPFDPLLTQSIDITSKAAYNRISESILQHGLYFDGIVAASDMVALGALKALKERYIDIPNEVGIVGFDDIEMAELFHPALTTIRQDTLQAAQAMVQELIKQFKGEPATSSMIDIELITRRSSKISQ